MPQNTLSFWNQFNSLTIQQSYSFFITASDIENFKKALLERQLTYYDIFNIDKTSPIDNEALNKKYKQFALKLHPDKTNNDAQKQELFKIITEIVEILKDPIKKDHYDQFSVLSQQDNVGYRSPTGELQLILGSKLTEHLFNEYSTLITPLLSYLNEMATTSENQTDTFKEIEESVSQITHTLLRRLNIFLKIWHFITFSLFHTLKLRIENFNIAYFNFSEFPTLRFYFAETVHTGKTLLTIEQALFLLNHTDSSIHRKSYAGLIIADTFALDNQEKFNYLYKEGITFFYKDMVLADLDLTEVSLNHFFCMVKNGVLFSKVIITSAQINYIIKNNLKLSPSKHDIEISKSCFPLPVAIYLQCQEWGYYSKSLSSLASFASFFVHRIEIDASHANLCDLPLSLFHSIKLVKMVKTRMTEAQLIYFINNRHCNFTGLSFYKINLNLFNQIKSYQFSFSKTDNTKTLQFCELDFNDAIVTIDHLTQLAITHWDFFLDFKPDQFFLKINEEDYPIHSFSFLNHVKEKFSSIDAGDFLSMVKTGDEEWMPSSKDWISIEDTYQLEGDFHPAQYLILVFCHLKYAKESSVNEACQAVLQEWAPEYRLRQEVTLN